MSLSTMGFSCSFSRGARVTYVVTGTDEKGLIKFYSISIIVLRLFTLWVLFWFFFDIFFRTKIPLTHTGV